MYIIYWYMNIYWCIHANFCLKPNLTTKLTQNTAEIQTNSLVAETTWCGPGLTDKPLFSFNSRYDEWWPLLALMFLPTKHPMIDSETSASQLRQSRQSLYFLFNCWLDISLFASLFYNHQTTARVFAGGLFKYYSTEQYLILVYIYAQNNDGSMQK